ncbi:hypothetical protein [Lactobacillus delbrueckii]|uniref:hypothetical protein n=1 Tax=Lactobacillus delbrueckii TaxID=1584 RepID=UPI0037C8C6D9
MPLVAIGRCRQDLSWLTNEPDAWIWHGIGEDETAPAVKKLNDLNEDGNWHPFGYQNFVELLDDPDAPCELFNKIYLRGGGQEHGPVLAQAARGRLKPRDYQLQAN